MGWTEITRVDYQRDDLRHASDLRDAERAVIAPHLPEANRLGRPRTTDLREVINAIFYMTATRYRWRMLPKDLPPRSTVGPVLFLSQV